MRNLFSVALSIAVASAQHANENLFDYGPSSPLMAVGHLGEGLHVAEPHHTYGMAEARHEMVAHRATTGIDRDHYLEPVHTAEHHQTALTHREALGRSLDVEAHDPAHVFHSAEQLPQRAPHAFDQHLQDEIERQRMYYHQPKYHAQGSRHAHADFDQHLGKVDRHFLPGYGEHLGFNAAEEKSENFLDHSLENERHHEENEFVTDALVEHHDKPVNFYQHPYHEETAVHYHEAHIEDQNPDDQDAHHGPQLHELTTPVHHSEHTGYEHHTEEHHQDIHHETAQHHDTELYHGQQVHQDAEDHPSHTYDHYVHHQFHEDHSLTHPTYTDVTYHYEDPSYGGVYHETTVDQVEHRQFEHHEPVVYHQHSHEQTQPATHHTAPHVQHNPQVYQESTPVAEHHDQDHYHEVQYHDAHYPLHDLEHDQLVEDVYHAPIHEQQYQHYVELPLFEPRVDDVYHHTTENVHHLTEMSYEGEHFLQ